MYFTIQTVNRKVKRSLSQRGLLGTLGRLLTKPLEVFRTETRELSSQYRACRLEEEDFDRSMNIDTAVDADTGWMARIRSDNWIHGVGYAPVPIRVARHLLESLKLDYSQYTFIDYGAGKGRMLFLAAEFPFQKIIGIEYSESLFHALQHNIDSYRNPMRRCHAIEGVLQDAGTYDVPNEPLVLFFHHPFDADVFEQVITRVERSLVECPRDVRVIYYDPICGHLFERNGFFKRAYEGKRDEGVRYSSDWATYSVTSDVIRGTSLCRS